jgi:hypothetical protein
MKAPESSAPNRFPSSTASLIATANGMSLPGESSYAPRRRMFRSTSAILPTRQCSAASPMRASISSRRSQTPRTVSP